MAAYSVTEAKRHFSRLIDRALAGEEVIITRRGRPLVRLAAFLQTAAVNTPGDKAA